MEPLATLLASLALTTLSAGTLVHYVRKEMAHARTVLADARKHVTR